MRNSFETANDAYEYLHDRIIQYGSSFGDTRALFNVGFYIENPRRKQITNPERKWNLHYADSEWKWYLSGDPNIKKLGEIYGKVPAIWKRNEQLTHVIKMLRDTPDTRQAAISIYDAKEMCKYENDTPCTYAVQFTIIGGELCMSVYMRSNDLWYGFCNDQYQFASLQELVARELDIPTGWYYHHAHNMHLYNDKI